MNQWLMSLDQPTYAAVCTITLLFGLFVYHFITGLIIKNEINKIQEFRDQQMAEAVRHLYLIDRRDVLPMWHKPTESKWDRINACNYGFKKHFFFHGKQHLPVRGDRKVAYTNFEDDKTYGWTGTAYCEIIFKEA